MATTIEVEKARLFFSRIVVAPSGCWEWQGALNGSGYGMFGFAVEGGRTVSAPAHRVAFEWFVGHVDDEEQIDHLCRNRACVNPFHIEAVSRSENVRRAVRARDPRVQCRNGHLLTAETTRIWSTGKGKTCRYCLLCRRASRARNATSEVA